MVPASALDWIVALRIEVDGLSERVDGTGDGGGRIRWLCVDRVDRAGEGGESGPGRAPLPLRWGIARGAGAGLDGGRLRDDDDLERGSAGRNCKEGVGGSEAPGCLVQ